MRLFTNYRNAKTIILSEGQVSSLTEATDGKFSTDELSRFTDFYKRIKYCQQHLGEEIGIGSSRFVFQIDDETVLKLAVNDAGIAQNGEEATWDRQSYNFIPKIYLKGNHNEWIICEFVLPAEVGDFKHCLGIDWYTFDNFVETVASQYNGKKSACEMSYFQMEELMDKFEVLNDLHDYMCNNHIPDGDIRRIENWGLAKRNGDAYLVLLDHGFTEDIYYKYYDGDSDDGFNFTTEAKWKMAKKSINEANDGHFSTNNLAKISGYKNKVLYCQKHLGEYIGAGSSRVVFQIDDDRVLKLAFNEAGIEQNREECSWSDGRYSFLPKIYDSDPNGEWIISEFVLAAEKDDFSYYFGKQGDSYKVKTWNEFTEFLYSVEGDIKHQEWVFYSRDKLDIMCRNKLLGELSDYIRRTNVSVGDLTRIENWGLAKRDGDAMPVLIDAGWRKGMMDEFYRNQDICMDVHDLLHA